MFTSTEGDSGDAVFQTGVLSELPGGPHTILMKPSGMTKARDGDGFNSFCRIFIPLAKSQKYIADCRVIAPDDKIDWPSQEFRKIPFQGITLFAAHLNHLVSTCKVGQGITGKNKWLFDIKPSKESKNRIIINRTARYRNWTFPWKTVVDKYKDRIMFVGLEHEWREFCGSFGNVEWRKTGNLLEVAELISGSLLFMGNQSSANAIAEGLKHRMIQETSLSHPDCIFKRDNAQHVVKGTCILPGFDGDEDTETEPLGLQIKGIDTITTPPGEWQLVTPDGEIKRSRSYSGIIHTGRLFGMTEEQVVEENIRRNYEYFFKAAHGSIYEMAENALYNSGITTR